MFVCPSVCVCPPSTQTCIIFHVHISKSPQNTKSFRITIIFLGLLSSILKLHRQLITSLYLVDLFTITILLLLLLLIQLSTQSTIHAKKIHILFLGYKAQTQKLFFLLDLLACWLVSLSLTLLLRGKQFRKLF